MFIFQGTSVVSVVDTVHKDLWNSALTIYLVNQKEFPNNYPDI